MKNPRILEVIDGAREARGMTRAVMADKMETESGYPWDKEKLDKIFGSCSCPRAETLFLMMTVVGMTCWPWKWTRGSKRGVEIE